MLLGAIALGVAGGGALLGGTVIPMLLGSDWALAGTLVEILAVTSAVRLVASPLSRLLLLLQKSTANIALDLLRLTLMGGAMISIIALEISLIPAVWTLYTSLALTYAATWVYIYKAVRQGDLRPPGPTIGRNERR